MRLSLCSLLTPTNTSQHKPLDIITLFHSPSLPASTRALALLKQASAASSATATEDQATSTSPRDSPFASRVQRRSPFEYNIKEDPPTSDELKLILDYLPKNSRVGEVVDGAKDRLDALRRCREDPGRFKRPVVSMSNTRDMMVSECGCSDGG